VGVAAKLGVDAGVEAEREIVGHHRHGAAEEAEGRGGHVVVLEGDERGDASAHGRGEQSERVGVADVGLPAGVLGAAHVLALGLAEGQALAGGEGDGHGLLRRKQLRLICESGERFQL